MFIRRKPVRGVRLLKEYFWPSMGWGRTLKYLGHRVVRLSDTTYKIACGLAIGAAISFSPLVGTHFLQALALAYFARASYLAAMIGTFWGNPWTFPFMWVAGYQMGSMIFSIFGVDQFSSLPEDLTFSMLWTIVLDKPMSLFLPWMLGAYVCALLFWPIAYVSSFVIIRMVQNTRRRKMIARRQKYKQQNNIRNNI